MSDERFRIKKKEINFLFFFLSKVFYFLDVKMKNNPCLFDVIYFYAMTHQLMPHSFKVVQENHIYYRIADDENIFFCFYPCVQQQQIQEACE